MKLLYQHLLAFLAVIITSIGIMGMSVIHYTRETAYEQNFVRLEGYAHAIGNLGLNNRSHTMIIDGDFLLKMQNVMSEDDVTMRIFDNKNEQICPVARADLRLPKKIFSQLKRGASLRVRNDHEKRGAKLSNSKAYTSVLVPWFYKGKLVGAILIGSRVANLEASIVSEKRNLLVAFLFSLLVGLILSLVISLYNDQRIKRLSQATQKVAAGDFSIQLDDQGKDEFDELARNFNKMIVALKKSQEEVAAQEKRRDQFMADAAHEMRTPLTTINGILEGLQYDVIPEDSKPKSIALMQRETKRLIRLVNENLDYEKIRNNQIMLVKANFNATQVLTDLLTQMKNKAQQMNDKLELSAPEELPVYADHDRFTQIMVNLVQNALQFTQNGTVKISGRRIEHGAEFAVKDSGIGMSKEQQKYIFERFYKADPSRARAGTGESGLGLAIVLSLVKQHGGQIKVESEPQHGSTFTFTIFDHGYEQYVKAKQ
ncbi:MAG: HAMP domain-containing histidine kinase [Lactobacillus sp.]|jgi:signal transduction histidine kinase|nr:HAMP domain-containing histidine kinase [Lactobacillus sp.]